MRLSQVSLSESATPERERTIISICPTCLSIMTTRLGRARLWFWTMMGALALAPIAVQAAACSGTYTVQARDTCNSIGYKAYVSTYQLIALNIEQTGPSCDQLETGMGLTWVFEQELCLGEFGSDCQVVHQVGEHETCSSIASDFGTTPGLIEANNPTMGNCTNMYPGLMLCVSAGLIHPPAPASLHIVS